MNDIHVCHMNCPLLRHFPPAPCLQLFVYIVSFLSLYYDHPPSQEILMLIVIKNADTASSGRVCTMICILYCKIFFIYAILS